MMSKTETQVDLPFHDAANIFPLLEGEEFDQLVKDIRKYGLREELALLDGKVIDGRNRYRACLLAGVERRYIEIETDDPVAYVLSLNLHRRHLKPGQASMVAARAKGIYEEQAKERQRAAGGDHVRKALVENLPQAEVGKARDKAGKALGVSGRSVDHASRVLEQGTSALVKAVDDGRMAVSTAAILTTEPPEVQDAEATAAAAPPFRMPSRRRLLADWLHAAFPAGRRELPRPPGRAMPRAPSPASAATIRGHADI